MRLVALIAMVAVACGSSARTPEQSASPGAVVDGLKLGAPVDCTPCDLLTPAAVAKLNATIPNHAAIVRVSYFMDPLPSGAQRSGISTVAVVDLADGTRSAILVYCGVGGCTAG